MTDINIDNIEIDITREWPRNAAGRSLYWVSYVFSMAGGLVMVGIGVMVVVSILGRALFKNPIYGDVELVAVFTGISVFLFLPYCHLTKNNVIVDLFLASAPERFRAACDVMASLIFGVLAFTLAWRSALGGIAMFHNHETTMILSIPVWFAFPFMVVSLGLLGVCCLYTAAMDFLRIMK